MDNYIIGLYGVTTISSVTFSFTLPFIFFHDGVSLSAEFLKRLGVLTPSFLPKLLALYIYFHTVITFYVVILKWLRIPPLLIAGIYSCSDLISKKRRTLDAWENGLNLYRTAYIFVEIFNQVFNFLLMAVKVSCITIISTGLTLCIVNDPSLIFIPVILEAGAMLLFTNVTFSYASTIFKLSEEFIHKLKIESGWNREKSDGESQRKIRRRTLASLRKCRIYCGGQYFIDPPVLLKINATILETTINFVILFRKLKK